MRNVIIHTLAHGISAAMIALPRDDDWRDHRDAYKNREYRLPRQGASTKRSNTKRRRKK